ncbi:uncharacterized protein VP01_2590g1, partial [Puccinia sorghi]
MAAWLEHVNCRHKVAYEIDLALERESRPSKFIITSYHCILGMPCILPHGNWMNWNNRALNLEPVNIVTAIVVILFFTHIIAANPQ